VCLAACSDSSLKKSATEAKCITNCKANDASFLGVNTLDCITPCTKLGAEFKTSIDREKCLYPFESCGDPAYFADVGSTYLCVKCDTAMGNCLACTSRTICTSCVGGTKLVVASATSAYCRATCLTGYKLENSGSVKCIANCSTNADANKIENSAKTECTSACAAGIVILY